MAYFKPQELFKVDRAYNEALRNLLNGWSNFKFETNNDGVIEIEEYERILSRDSRDVTKIKQHTNQNTIARLTFFGSIVTIAISILF